MYHHYVGMIISLFGIYHDLIPAIMICFTHVHPFSRENLAVHHALQCWWRSNRAAADLFERWRMYAKRQPFHSGPEGTLGFILDLWYENCGGGKNTYKVSVFGVKIVGIIIGGKNKCRFWKTWAFFGVSSCVLRFICLGRVWTLYFFLMRGD